MKLTDLDKIIPQYVANKNELDSYKKICDRENAKIKAIMKDFKILKYETREYKALYTISKREQMNEEMLLEIAHNYGLSEIVKTKEYIDFDALEKAIYDNKIPNEVLMEMNKAKEVKEVVTLRVLPLKKERIMNNVYQSVDSWNCRDSVCRNVDNYHRKYFQKG